MSTGTKTQKAGQAIGHEAATKEQTLLDRILDNPVKYKPFMGDIEVTLSARLVLRMFAKPTKAGAVCTPEQAAIFVRLCEARGLNPFEGDAYIVGYDSKAGPVFNLITAFQALLKRAEIHPEYNGMECGVTLKGEGGTLVDIEGDLVPDGGVIVGGWARVHFKTRAIPTYRRVSLAKFNKNVSVWETNAPGMIVKVAKAAAIRESFPTKCGGLYLREEMDGSQTLGEPELSQPVNSLVAVTAGLRAAAAAKANGAKPAIESDLEQAGNAAFCGDPEPEYDPATGEMPLDDDAQAHASPLLDEAQLAFESVDSIIDCRAIETAWLGKVSAAEKSHVSAMASAAQQRIRGGRGEGSNK